MPDILLTRFLARKARDAAKAVSGAKPTHLSEAVAAGLGYGSHASLLASLQDAPPGGLVRPWDPDAMASWLASLDASIDRDVATAAASSAGDALASGGGDGFHRLAEIVARVVGEGGGAIYLEGGHGHTGVRIVHARGGAPYRQLPDGLQWDMLTSTISGTPTKAGAFTFDPKPEVFLDGVSLPGLIEVLEAAAPLGREPGPVVDRVAFLPPALFGLARGVPPIVWGAIRTGGSGLHAFLEIPPKVSSHEGVAAVSGLVGGPTSLEALDGAVDPSPGLRFVRAPLGRGGPSIARAYALTAAGRGGYEDCTQGEGVDMDRLPLDLAGRVFLLPPILNIRASITAKELAGRGAAVWSNAYIGMGASMRAPAQNLLRSAIRLDLHLEP